MAYASQNWTKDLLKQTLVAAKDQGLLGGGGESGDVYYGYEGYSEDEVCIGQYMGKPLYRKITLTTLGAKSVWTKICELGCATESIILEDCYVNFSMTWVKISNFNSMIYVNSNGEVYAYTTDANHANQSALSIVEYTKTTDAENSFTPSMVTDNKTLISSAPTYEDYSTEEKCIGKFVDGKPIYQKCIRINKSYGSGTNAIYDATSLSIDKIISIDGICSDGTSYSNTSRWNLSAISSNAGRILWMNGQNITFTATQTSTSYIDTIVIRYTKTTDAENSFSPSMITNGIIVEDVTDDDVDDVFELMEETDNG